MNINGRNSSLSPNTTPSISEQYKISGMLNAIYNRLNRSSKKMRGRLLAGASRSKDSRKSTSQKIVYTVLMGNSAVVKMSGKRDTCPATARGRKAPR